MITTSKTVDDGKNLTVEMCENGNILCSASASFFPNYAEITDITDNEFTVDMAKSILNIIELRGIIYVECALSNIAVKLEILKFKKEDGIYKLSLINYFKGC